MTVEVRCVADPASVSETAAHVFTLAAIDAVRQRGVFSVALAGGSTPRGLYSLLATDDRWRHAVPWERTEFFWSDERHVAPDHADSNFRMAYEALLSRVPVQPDRVHRVIGEHHDAAVAASWYEVDVRELAPSRLAVPALDLVILGIGPDGHVASLCPDSPALDERDRLVVANWVETLGAFRITMTLPLINAARQVLFIAAGGAKAAAVAQALGPARSANVSPAQRVRAKHVVWVLDRAAGQLLGCVEDVDSRSLHEIEP